MCLCIENYLCPTSSTAHHDYVKLKLSYVMPLPVLFVQRLFLPVCRHLLRTHSSEEHEPPNTSYPVVSVKIALLKNQSHHACPQSIYTYHSREVLGVSPGTSSGGFPLRPCIAPCQAPFRSVDQIAGRARIACTTDGGIVGGFPDASVTGASPAISAAA